MNNYIFKLKVTSSRVQWAKWTGPARIGCLRSVSSKSFQISRSISGQDRTNLQPYSYIRRPDLFDLTLPCVKPDSQQGAVITHSCSSPFYSPAERNFIICGAQQQCYSLAVTWCMIIVWSSSSMFIIYNAVPLWHGHFSRNIYNRQPINRQGWQRMPWLLCVQNLSYA